MLHDLVWSVTVLKTMNIMSHHYARLGIINVLEDYEVLYCYVRQPLSWKMFAVC